MRSLALLTLVSSVSFAQNGVWTGYVNGWVSNPAPVAVPFRSQPVRRSPLSQNQQVAIAVSNMAAQQAYWSQMNYVERQKENARRDEQELATRRLLVEQQEAALNEQRIQQAWVEAEQQRRAGEEARRIADAREKENAEIREKLVIAQGELARKALDEQAAREKEIAAREAERLARAKEDEKNGIASTIYKWVDDDGVMHISTKPRGR